METTELCQMTETKLKRIAWLSENDPHKEFGCLMHLINEESLKECFHKLNPKKAVGIDGIDKPTYGKDLDINIKDLMTRMKAMAYIPMPVREVLIPKEGKPGATRPLGISILEDKIVQRMTQRILESIYEPIFLDCSFGFRPGKSCHHAIKALSNHIYSNDIQTVIDIDLKYFFGTIDHKIMEDILKMKIKDTRFMRYINRMFKAGVLSDGDLVMSDEGVPQGSICSPILANVFAHYSIDLWIKEMVIPNCKGKVALFRYADDAVICCQYAEDASRIKSALGKRLEKFKLQINEEKTKLVSFDKRKAARGIEQETFDFLGFTFYLGKSKKGWVIPKLKTKAKTFCRKIKNLAKWFKEIKDKSPMRKIWKIFCAKVRGHIQYYAVSHNFEAVVSYIKQARRIAFKWLNRRSQRKSFNWEKFQLYLDLYPLPEAKIVHKLF
jgi:group II intron reverse transcriptase/maturase